MRPHIYHTYTHLIFQAQMRLIFKQSNRIKRLQKRMSQVIIENRKSQNSLTHFEKNECLSGYMSDGSHDF